MVIAFSLLASDSRKGLPDRVPGSDKIATLRLDRVDVPRDAGAGVAVTRAWKLVADDPRVMGLSSLAVMPDGRLQALSDSGVLVTFSRPGGAPVARVNDLPDGPGYPTFKRYRDSEAMIVDPDGRGRLVAFENQHSVWRYASDGRAERLPLALPSARWRKNEGIEAMLIDPADGRLLLLHEGGKQALRIDDALRIERLTVEGATGGVADAIRLPNGRMVAAIREIGLTGLTNRLAWMERTSTGYRLRNFASLRLGPFDNVEGLAAERGPDGRTILWAITDNDGWRRTLLLRIELNTTKAPA